MVQKSLRRTWWGHLVGTPGRDTSYQHESSGSGGGSSRLPTPQTGNMITHTHSHYILERNPWKTRKNAKLKNAGPTEITDAYRQTAGAPTGGIRLQTSKRHTHTHTHTHTNTTGAFIKNARFQKPGPVIILETQNKNTRA